MEGVFMTEKIIDRSSGHEIKPRKRSLNDSSETLSRARELEDARSDELDRQLTILGFPDGEAIRKLRTDQIHQPKPSSDKADSQRSKGSVVEDIKQEFWDLTHVE